MHVRSKPVRHDGRLLFRDTLVATDARSAQGDLQSVRTGAPRYGLSLSDWSVVGGIGKIFTGLTVVQNYRW